MDTFRQYQKQECKDGSSRDHTYGCQCCRKIGNLGEFKKWSRKLAKSRLKQQDQKENKFVIDSEE